MAGDKHHVLGSSFVPARYSIDNAGATRESTGMEPKPPELGQSLFDNMAKELSTQLATHFTTLHNEVQANGLALKRVQDSVANLSKQVIEQNRSASVDASS
eukprot:CAMPEP_0172904036 /NCGR_PEP_ID=MMETSP1075-20121228/171795_1 /TAXON_ID=2916 /ORGANISM="Ceratium fusus, Strain PA161109" /LENGTH=100 /DNA_ID=CAMNT_0013760989 /DNA_START=81 /DNA_END=380 /DNA_ORIENTATION=-